MWIALLSVALAAPPALVQWTQSDLEIAEDDDNPQPTPTRVAFVPVGTHVFEALELRHAWVDGTSMDVSIAGEGGQLYYLQSTARSADYVAHWRQGPYITGNESMTIELALPAEVASSLTLGDQPTLSTRILVTDLSGNLLAQTGLRRCFLSDVGGRPARLALGDALSIDVAQVDVTGAGTDDSIPTERP